MRSTLAWVALCALLSFFSQGAHAGFGSGAGGVSATFGTNAASALTAVEKSPEAIAIAQGLFDIPANAISNAAMHFGQIVTTVFGFLVKVELDPDAAVGRQVIQGIEADRQATGVPLGSAGHYARSVGLSEAEIAEFGLR